MTRRLLLPAALALAAALAWAAPSRRDGGPARSVAISYADLLPPDAIVRTGEALRDAVRRADRRGAVQPFVDRFSFLLPHAVTMVYGAGAAPFESLAERYAPSAAQPAWAAILRAGRLHVSTDGRGRVRIFAPGDEPRTAYRRHYGVLRHPLGRLAAERGGPLDVEVFAYRNDYRTSELRLVLQPFRFRASRFPAGRTALDLGELGRFFRRGGALEGAELSRAEGLVLYASPGGTPTLEGQPASLADLAVAYRAVFHAGDNEAFVSLDPHRDPTLATVNFGGLLEDTRIGRVVLAADKRFKTVCSGLDPESHADVRAEVRRVVPSFLTNTERSFSGGRAPARTAWISTRYWYFPGSAGVEVDPGGTLAAVTRPRFDADAERFGEEYLGASAKAKKAALPAEVRENIRDLNANRDRYARVFPELRELSSVARFMAICSWLRRAAPAWLDLDGLLAAELPAAGTPREVPRLLTAEFLQIPEGRDESSGRRRDVRVVPLNPELDQTVEEVFRDPAGLASFLALRAGERGRSREREEEARTLFEAARGRAARSLVRTEGDLRAFLRSVAARVPRRSDAEEDADADRVRSLRARLARETGPDGPAPAEVEELRSELGAIMKKYHEGTRARAYTVVQHTGGISMEPRLFQVRRARTSPALDKLRQASRGAGAWVRSRPARPRPAQAEAPATPGAPSPEPRARGRGKGLTVGTPPPPSAPRLRPAEEVAPPAEELAASAAPPTPALRRIEVSTKEGGGLVGRLAADGRIVFTRAGK